MPFFVCNRRAAVRHAKDYAALIDQLGIPFAITVDQVVVAGNPLGHKLVELAEAQEAQHQLVIWFDEHGYDRHFRCIVRAVSFKRFKGYLWLFFDDTEDQKDLEDIQGRLKYSESRERVMSEALNNLTFPVWIEGRNHQIYFQNSVFTNQFESGANQGIKDILRDSLESDSFLRRIISVIIKGERKQLEVKTQPLPGNRVLAWAPDRTDFIEDIAARDRLLNAQRSLFEQLRTAVATFDQSTALTFYNSAYTELWGMDDAYLNTQPKLGDILEHLREQRRLPEQADFRTFKSDILNRFTELLGPLEEMLYLPDGRTLRLLTIPNPSGGLLITFEDVTNTLELESSLNTLMAVQRETLDNMTEAMAVYGGDGRLKLWNPQYAKLWGLYPEELDGAPHITTLVDSKLKNFNAETATGIYPIIMNLALGRQELSGRFVFESGQHINYASIPLPDGATLQSYDDVTDTVQVEQALRDRAAALEDAERLKTDFLANVSYQLRTPLNAIIGFAELLEHKYFGDLNAKQMEYASGITDAGQRLLSLIDDILDLSTIEAGYMSVNRDTVDIARMVRDVYALTEEWARKSQHVYKLSLPDQLGSMQGDERRLKQALLNLIRNAINFTPKGGFIEVGAHTDAGICRIWVKDSGVGIASEDQSRVFKAFERVEEMDASGRNSGAGLGLSLVKSIVELHDGSVDLVSTPENGTTVTITLPVS